MIHIQWYKGVVGWPYTSYPSEADEGSCNKQGPMFADDVLLNTKLALVPKINCDRAC
jgi:hypothetical protein